MKELFWDKHLFLFLLFIAYSLNLQSQTLGKFTAKDGLPQSYVSGLVQDDEGFLWVATRNGLARYDGIHFKTFQHDAVNANSIASNLIIWISKDAKGYLWLEYESGIIDRFNPKTEQILHFSDLHSLKQRNFQFERKGWHMDQNGRFWGIHSGKGLNVYDSRTGKIERYNRNSGGLTSDTLRAILEDSQKQLWVLSQKAISKFDPKANRFVHYKISVKQDFNTVFDSEKQVVDLHERSNGEIMWGDCGTLYFFNPKKQSFKIMELSSKAPVGIRWIRISPDGTDYFERNGEIYHLDRQGKITRIVDKNWPESLDVRSIWIDKSGIIWIGTNAQGLFQLDFSKSFFRSFPYKEGFPGDLLEEEFNISIAAAFGWEKENAHFSGTGYHFRSAYCKDQLWMALKKTVYCYDKRTKNLVRLPNVPIVNYQKENAIGIKGITFMPDGSPMVVAFNGEVLYFDRSTGAWKPFIDNLQIRKQFGNSILPLDILNDGKRTWISTENDGLLYFDNIAKDVHQIKYQQKSPIPTNQLLALYPDPFDKKILWIGSYQGLVRFDKETFKSKVFTSKDGLPDNTIYSVTADKKGYFWLSSNKGLCRFNPRTYQMRVFRDSYGLPGDEFNRFHNFTLPDGRMAFGGPEGWILFDPLAVKDDHFNPNVAFTDLMVNNKSVPSNEKGGILSVPLNATKRLVLHYDQNSIAVSFAGLQFNQPGELSYRYMLEGYDNDWIQAGHYPIANYTKIPPGTYTLKINSSNTAGRWSDKTKELTIVITPPFWRTFWAYLFYVILLSWIIWLYTRYRINQEVLAKEIALKEKEAQQFREMSEIKSRFFSNITHEFRTPLTLILGPAEQLIERHSHNQQDSAFLDMIRKNANQLLNLINQLLDLAKLEAKMLMPTESSGSPADVVEESVHAFQNDSISKGITLKFTNRLGNEIYIFAPNMLERIVYNLVSNAIKFTEAGGSVEISIAAVESEIVLTVADTGCGIDEHQVGSIFDRFYQAEHPLNTPERQQSGTGIGLAYVKELTQVQGGRIEVKSATADSEDNLKGTIFKVFLPYKKTDQRTNGGSATEYLFEDDPEIRSEDLPDILLVEDNVELIAFMRSSLQEKYNILFAENGFDGVKIACETIPDIIISDVMMPVMDGFAMCAQLKQDIRTSHIPIILLTAKDTKDNLVEGLATGADDYLIKPFHMPELLLRIQNLLLQQARIRAHAREGLSHTGDETVPVIQNIFIVKLHHLIEEHLDDTLFGVDSLAVEIGMSRPGLHRKLKAISDLSASEVIRNYRITRAAQFLKEGYNSMEAAYKSGFNSPAYFSKCFKDFYRVTPTEFVRDTLNN